MSRNQLSHAAVAAACLSAFALSCATAATKQAAKSYLVYAGTYTDNTNSKGIYAFRFDPSSGELTPLGLEAETKSPSFLAADPSGRFLYAVNELENYEGKSAGSVSAFAMDTSTGKLTLLNTVTTRGAGPCHLAVDHTGKMLVVANYSSGSVASFPIGPDGRLGEAASFDQHSGKGTDPQRQEGPHAHCDVFSPNNKFVFVADLGLDKVFSYRADPNTAKLTPNDPPFTTVGPGSGPRHFAIHPSQRYAYSINEMKSTITTFSFDGKRGTLKELQTTSTLPADFHGENTTAEIVVHPNGRFVYGSNRGHDSIAVFSVNKGTGMLTPIETVPTGGKEPRNFEIDPTGATLFAANQKSDSIVLFRIDPKTGKLTQTGKTVAVAAPVCVIFVPSK